MSLLNGVGGPGTEIQDGNGIAKHHASRPSDDDILIQQNIIRMEEAAKIPYVADVEPLKSLKEEYRAGSDVFVHKIEKLEGKFDRIRRTRGDGNCFFRGFIYTYLESLLEAGDVAEVQRFANCIQGWGKKLVDCNYQELVFEDAMDLLLEQVNAIARAHNGLTRDALLSNFRDDTVSNMVVMFLRMITSCEIQRRQEFFAPFIMGLYDEDSIPVESFCQRFVEAMGEESDHVHIVAITDALQVPIKVLYLDRSGASQYQGAGTDLEVSIHEFIPEGLVNKQPRVHLLYRPGHYDILYPIAS